MLCIDSTDVTMGGTSVAQINCVGELSGDCMAGGNDPHTGWVDRNGAGIKE